MAVVFAVGLLALSLYSMLVIYHNTFIRARRSKQEAQEIAVVYMDRVPRCLGVLHTQGSILVPGSCVAPEGKYYVAFLDARKALPTQFPVRKIHAVNRTVLFPEYELTKNIGYNIAMLELNAHALAGRTRRPLDMLRADASAEYVRMGWFDRIPGPAPRYCNHTMYDGWYTSDMPQCQEIRGKDGAIDYKLGYLDFAARDGQLHLRSFNAPATPLHGAAISTFTALAAFEPWIENIESTLN